MRPYLVMAEVERFDALSRTIGYAHALELLDGLRGEVAARLGAGAEVRTTRKHLEISLPAESPEALETLLDEVGAAIARTVDVDGFAFDLALVFGAADPQGAPISDDLVVTAELALVEARRRQRAAVLPHARGAARGGDRLQMLRALQSAITNDRLELHYQPKLRARGGAVDSVEALIRWPQPDGSHIAPDAFIPVAEETGDIRAMTEWVLARAVTDLAALATAGVALRCDVNISGATLADRGFTRAMVDRVVATGGMIGFEITETAMIDDPARALANLRLCAEAGVRLAIDDYGAGFSSLAYLQQLPVGGAEDRPQLRFAAHQPPARSAAGALHDRSGARAGDGSHRGGRRFAAGAGAAAGDGLRSGAGLLSLAPAAAGPADRLSDRCLAPRAGARSEHRAVAPPRGCGAQKGLTRR